MSLNACPLTQYSEELALEDVMRDLEIRRDWSEQELVKCSGGQMFPGTPDGMFEEHSGALTCVQVVRVPVTEHMSLQQVDKIIYDTVLTKVVKSQRWMKATRILPNNFLIFCWVPPLPHGLYPTIVGSRTEELLDGMRAQGWPFYWTVKTPTNPGSLFPSAFAFHSLARGVAPRARKAAISEADLSTFCPTDFEEEEDDDSFEYDIFAIPELEEGLSMSDPIDSNCDEDDDDSFDSIEQDISTSLEAEDELAGGCILCVEKEVDHSAFDLPDFDCGGDHDDSFEYDVSAIPEVDDELADGLEVDDELADGFVDNPDLEVDLSELDKGEDDSCDCDMLANPEVSDERTEGSVDVVEKNQHSQGVVT